jgi:hypothetical protein
MDQEWKDIKKLIKFLEFYRNTTQACEGRFATIDVILPTMDFLLEQLEAGWKDLIYKHDPFMHPAIKAGWKKLNKYYNLTGRSIAYTAAIVLCPTMKWSYFSTAEWPHSWVTEAWKEVKNY